MRSHLHLGLAALVLAGCTRSGAPAHTPGVIASSSAGVRFPANRERLASEVDALLENGGLPAPGPVRAIVVPHAGLQFSGEAAAAAVAPIRDRRFDRVILLAPAHPALAGGAVLPQSRSFRTPLGDVPVDVAALALLTAPTFTRDDTPFLREHAIDAVLPLLQRGIGNVPMVPILLGSTDAAGARALAEALRPLVDSRTLVVVSTNLTHAGPRFGNLLFAPDHGQALHDHMQQADQILLDPVLHGQLDKFDALARSTHTTLCGQDALRVLLALMPAGARGTVRRYDSSFAHDQASIENQVSYAGIVFSGSWPELAPLPEADAQALLRAAHQAMAAQIAHQDPPAPPHGTVRLLEKRGIFITLYEGGQVRASVGQLESSEPLANTVVSVATAVAAGKDPRFPALGPDELGKVRVEIAVVGPRHGVPDPSEVDLARDGLYLDAPEHHGLLLPARSGQAPTLEVALDALAQKANLPRDDWKDAHLTRFATQFFADPGPAR